MSREDGSIARLRKILQANFNDMIDKAENPEKMMRQWVRDNQKVLKGTQMSLVAARSKVKELNFEISKLKTSADSYHEGARIALENSDEDTAGKALAKENDERRRIKMREADCKGYEALAEKLQVYVDRAREKVQEGELEAERLTLEYQAASVASDVAEMSTKSISTDIDQVKDRIARRTRQKQARADVLDEMESEDVDSKIEHYQRLAEFDPEKALADLKTEVGS